MANSVVEIANNVLSRLGDKTILSLSDDNDRARWFNRLYPSVRDSVLRKHDWNFARQRAELAQDVDSPVWGYKYKYPLPPDCLKVRKVNDEAGNDDWSIESGYLFTDFLEVKIIYTRREENPGMFDSSFCECLEVRLAAEMAIPVTGNQNIANTMWALYDRMLREARGENYRERPRQSVSSNVLTDER